MKQCEIQYHDNPELKRAVKKQRYSAIDGSLPVLFRKKRKRLDVLSSTFVRKGIADRAVSMVKAELKLRKSSLKNNPIRKNLLVGWMDPGLVTRVYVVLANKFQPNS